MALFYWLSPIILAGLIGSLDIIGRAIGLI